METQATWMRRGHGRAGQRPTARVEQRRSPLEAGVSSRGAKPGGVSWAARGKQKRAIRGGLRQIPAQ
jgi:hypothetical protein